MLSNDEQRVTAPQPGATQPVQPQIGAPGTPTPPPAHPMLPRPTYWPIGLAFGITLFAWGIITSLFILVIGLLVMFAAIGGWIGDLLHDH